MHKDAATVPRLIFSLRKNCEHNISRQSIDHLAGTWDNWSCVVAFEGLSEWVVFYNKLVGTEHEFYSCMCFNTWILTRKNENLWEVVKTRTSFHEKHLRMSLIQCESDDIAWSFTHFLFIYASCIKKSPICIHPNW